MSTLVIEELDAPSAAAAVSGLAEVLIDCVEGGASVGFILPMTHLRVARDDTGIVGTVQLQKATKENQPHRAEVSKLLVHRRARNRGLGERLMREIEAVAAREHRGVLVLDTATPEAERLYQRLGWQRTGAIPDYALMPDGSLCDTIVYWKHVATM
jgi:ribosomal protein S18 acetylase RimI-like enzyme